MAGLLDAGQRALEALRAAADPGRIAAEGRPLDEIELLAPVPRPGKVVAIGRNYREHVDEEGADRPPAPLIFSKWPSSVIGDGAEIRWDPELTAQVDYEAELGVVIGRTARRVSERRGARRTSSATPASTMSRRGTSSSATANGRAASRSTRSARWAPRSSRPTRSRTHRTSTSSCCVGDRVVQSANTSQMYFGVAAIISYCSQSFSLEPGDVIATGTPGGVGIFRDPPLLLGDGDEVTVEIEGVGRLRNVCRYEAATVASA